MKQPLFILPLDALLRKATHCLAEALEMHDLTLTQEFYYVVDVGVIRKSEYIVVGYSRLLLCSKVLRKIAKRIAL